MKTIIGVTGGLASGKTAATDLFVDKGAKKIDADQIAHDILQNDEDVKNKIITCFGENVLSDGFVDRRKLAERVFFDKEKLDELCAIIHPEIIRTIKDEIELIEEGVIVIDAPLLLESGLGEYVDITVVVSSGYEIQVERAINRGISEEEAINIIDNQMPLSEKIKCADYIIDNDGNFDTLKEGVEKIWQRI